MKYAVVFDSKTDAQKLLELLEVARIKAVHMELIEDTYSEMAAVAMDSMKRYVLYLEKTDSEKKLAELRKDYLKAYTAFQQEPTPAMASVLKRMGAKIKRDSKRVEG